MSHAGAVIAVLTSPHSSPPQKTEIRDPLDHEVAQKLVKLTGTATTIAPTVASDATSEYIMAKNKALSEKHGLDGGSMVMCWFNVGPSQYTGITSQYLLSAKRGAKTDKGVAVEGYCNWRQLLQLRQSKHINELYFEHPERPSSRIRLPMEPPSLSK